MSNANDASPLANTEVHYLRSEHVGDEFKLFIGHCGTLKAPPSSILFVTDANGFFGAAVDAVRSMQLADHLPPILIVGIGYRTGALSETITLRQRDLSPSVDPLMLELYPERTVMGGAAAFLAFIRDELVPWVEARYPTEQADRTYFGHSLGGLFGCVALLSSPRVFQRYVIGSPSLWWQHDITFATEQAYADANSDLAARVFFGVGALENDDGRQREASRLSDAERLITATRHIDMDADTLRFAAALESRGYPSLQVTSKVFPDEFHITVAPLTLSRGLRWQFDAPV